MDFTVSVKITKNCYLMLGGYNVSDKYEMVISLPPAEPQEVKPMDKPSSSGGEAEAEVFLRQFPHL